MATSSFYEMMRIDTPEKAAALNAAYHDAEERGPLTFEGPTFDELLEEGRQFLRDNPNWLNEAAAAAKERLKERGFDLSELTED
ncbi:MAG: hypothetical protein FWG58_05025 [Methanomassiliicoccaceae archaeon]|nr:hypothetical protein [Methanomassiliicoccaceae archaeon]